MHSQVSNKQVAFEDYPLNPSPIKDGAKVEEKGPLFSNQLLSQKVNDPDFLPDKTLQYTAKKIGKLPT